MVNYHITVMTKTFQCLLKVRLLKKCTKLLVDYLYETMFIVYNNQHIITSSLKPLIYELDLYLIK